MRSHIRSTLGMSLIAVVGLIALGVTISCTGRAEPTRASTDASHLHMAAGRAGTPSPELGPKMAALRESTVRYHDFAAAQADGYTVKVTDCMEDATRGGMGFHYAKGSLIDGGVIEAMPEVLLYVPQGNGELHLIGVEFIIPFTAWTASEPPALYGQTFGRNETFQVWALHVWVWRNNPDGMFADWNPKVSCSGDGA